MLPFLELVHMVDTTSSVGFGVGWGWYRSLDLHTWSMLPLLWGLGWGGDVTVPWTCTHGRCYVFFGVWVGMLPFLELAFCGVWGGVGMVPFDATSSVGFGVGWGCYRVTVPWTCTHGQCMSMLRLLWGLGWGGDVTVPCTCAHGRCYVFFGVWGAVVMLPFLELAHMVDTTSSVGFGVGWGCYRSLNLHTWSMLRLLWGLVWGGDVAVPWTCTHCGCYVFCGVWGGDVTVPCTCAHGRCYVFFGVWGAVGMLPFLELAHMVDTTSSVGFGVGWGCCRSLNLHTWSMLLLLWGLVGGGDVAVPWTCTHGRCYVLCVVWGGVGMLPLLELAHMVDATSSVGFWGGVGNLHTWSMLRLLCSSLMKSLARKNGCSLQKRSSFPEFWNTEFSCCLNKVLFFSS